MSLPEEHARIVASFPAALQDLIRAEVAAGNVITQTGGNHPAPPDGAWVMLSGPVTTRARSSGGGLTFFERQGSHHSGEFTDAAKTFWVLEPPVEYTPPDMDAIREELAARERAANASMDNWR